jgi:hypothetical protein
MCVNITLEGNGIVEEHFFKNTNFQVKISQKSWKELN